MQISVVEPSWLKVEASFESGSAVANHLHGPVLLDPQLAYDNVVHAAVHVGPSVGFSPSSN